MSHRFAHVFLLLLASLALPAATLAEAPDNDRAESQDARPQGPGFFERFRDFRHFPVGRGRIGVQIQPMTPELRAFMGAPEDRGVLVERVVEGSPAEAAGIRVGDVITEAGGEPIERTVDLIRAVHSLDAEEALELSFVRDEKTDSLEVTPAEAGEHPARRHLERLHGIGCEAGQCGHRGHHRNRIEQRLDEVEKRLRKLEERDPPDSDGGETAT